MTVKPTRKSVFNEKSASVAQRTFDLTTFIGSGFNGLGIRSSDGSKSVIHPTTTDNWLS